MKRITVLALILITLPLANAFAQGTDVIALPSPEVITNPAVNIQQVNLGWDGKTFKVKYDKLDAQGKVVATEVCVIKDREELATPGSCSDPQYRNEDSCTRVQYEWVVGGCSKRKFEDKTTCEAGGNTWVDPHCTKEGITTPAECRAYRNTWTAPVMTAIPEFTVLDTATIKQEYVGMSFKEVIANALHAVCATKLGIPQQ